MNINCTVASNINILIIELDARSNMKIPNKFRQNEYIIINKILIFYIIIKKKQYTSELYISRLCIYVNRNCEI